MFRLVRSSLLFILNDDLDLFLLSNQLFLTMYREEKWNLAFLSYKRLMGIVQSQLFQLQEQRNQEQQSNLVDEFGLQQMKDFLWDKIQFVQVRDSLLLPNYFMILLASLFQQLLIRNSLIDNNWRKRTSLLLLFCLWWTRNPIPAINTPTSKTTITIIIISRGLLIWTD